MSHIHELNIKQFRGVKNLVLSQLPNVALLVGGNNSGKTSVLEAVELICNPMDPSQLITTALGRDRGGIHTGRIPVLQAVEWLYPIYRGVENENPEETERDQIALTLKSDRLETELTVDCFKTWVFRVSENNDPTLVEALDITFSGAFTQEGQSHYESKNFILSELERLKIEQSPRDKVINTTMVTPVDHRILPLSSKSLTQTIKSGDRSGIIDLLKMFDKNIEGLEILAPNGGTPIPHIRHKNNAFVPVSMYGDGLRRILTLASAVLSSKDGVLMVDEIETAVHSRMLTRVFSWLIQACADFNVQLIATTHSLEAIDAVLEAFVGTDEENAELLNHFATYRLIPNENQTIAKRFSGKSLYDLRYEFGQDVR